MSKERLTAKQQQILEVIKTAILERGYPPSVREMCMAVGLSSTSSVHAHLEALEKKGYIKKDPAKPRTIEVMDDTFNLNRREIVNIPLLGDVAAGEPIFAAENISNYYPMPVDMLPNSETFMLNVKGDSMINAGIFNGDKILVAKQNTAENGEIVVAMVDDSATVKRFYKEKGHFRLKPENDAMDDIIVKDLEILGKVIGLLRMM
jgi:repressor lexA